MGERQRASANHLNADAFKSKSVVPIDVGLTKIQSQFIGIISRNFKRTILIGTVITIMQQDMNNILARLKFDYKFLNQFVL